MILKTKYNLGDKVYYMKKKNGDFDIDCPFCEGKGMKFISPTTFETILECKNCSGIGKIRVHKETNEREKVFGVIRYVECSTNNRGEKYIRYKLEVNGKSCYLMFDEESLFLEEKENV